MPTTKPSSPASPKLPSAFELFTPSWEAIKINASPIIVFFTLTVVLSLIASIAGTYISPAPALNPETATLIDILKATYTPYTIISNLIISLISLLVAPGLLVALLKGAKGESIGVWDAFKTGLSYFWRYFGLTLLVGLMTFVGLLLFIVPGLIIIRRYYLASYYLLDKNLSALDAMRASKADSKPFSRAIWGVIGVTILFAMLNLIPIVGLILTFVYLAAPAIRYLQIQDAR